jgi:diguanylate cyclase (GGDEF)-like protein/PAS domain S-box-containing protein
MTPSSDHLLVVDDNEANCDMLARRLVKNGYKVSVAHSAHGLLDRIERESIDLVLLDIEMPEITGLDALVSIRRAQSSVHLPVIMVTARSQSEDIVKALELGANDYVTKPIDFPVALARIRTHLSHMHKEQALRESEERYALAARGANDGLWDWNLRDDTIYFSPRWKAMLGCGEAEIQNRPQEWFDRIHPSDRDTVQRCIAEHFKGQTPYFEAEARMLHKDGMFRWMLSRGLMIRDEAGTPVRMAGSQTDITEGKVADPMTGLPNRLLFIDRLSQVLEHRRRHPGTQFAVLFLDLDGFKLVNDSFGHAVGDRLLIQVAARLEGSLRHTDKLVRLSESFTFARLGGDEFAILLNALKDPADATRVAERLLEALAEPFVVDGNEFFTSASIGIAMGTLGYHHPEEYVRDADTAMYKAKELGKGRFEVFDADMRASITQRLQLETDLRRGLERGELRAFYQPIISLERGDIVGFEALVRWQHPTRGLLQPVDFIPIAEETGMIREVGWWILTEACARITAWRKLHPSGELTMSVNLSVKQFLQANFSARLQALLDEHEVPAGTLKLELTESCIMSDPATSVALLTQIKSLGVRLAIDDFGTGYSSLSYLQRFPLDTLKIDRSFTMAMAADGKNDGVIARTIIPLAQQLGLDVVAEGVETVEQAALLKDLECKYAQGFLFSWPLSAEEVQQALIGMLGTPPADEPAPSESLALP